MGAGIETDFGMSPKLSEEEEEEKRGHSHMTSALRGKGAGSKADGDSTDRLCERDSDKR